MRTPTLNSGIFKNVWVFFVLNLNMKRNRPDTQVLENCFSRWLKPPQIRKCLTFFSSREMNFFCNVSISSDSLVYISRMLINLIYAILIDQWGYNQVECLRDFQKKFPSVISAVIEVYPGCENVWLEAEKLRKACWRYV